MSKKYNLKIEYAIIGFVISALVYLFSLLGVFTPLADFARSAIGSIQEFCFRTGVEITESVNAISQVGILSDQTDNLTQQNILLKAELIAVKAENVSLSKQITQNIKYPDKQQVYARVRSIAENMSEIIIGAGQSQGIAQGDIVIVSNIPVGEITEVGYQYSKVKLISSSDIKIPIQFSNSKLNGILEYDQTQGFTIKNLPSSYNYVKGEDIITTGINSPYFSGQYVGMVESVVGSQTDPARTVKVEYPLNLNELEEVFVVLNSAVEIK